MKSSNNDIIIAIGSNYKQKENINFARQQLLTILGKECVFTDDVWTDPLGIESDKFLNCMCRATTKYHPDQLRRAFKRMEKQCSRSKKNDSMGIIPLDIDILLLGDNRFHESDWNRDYIKFLLGKVNYFYQENL